MIFNPLFLSDNTGSQIMAPKQTKMSNNKYLFSDIVKVVMAPIDEQNADNKGVSSLFGSNIGLSLEQDQKPVQLKLKFLSDLDNENAKLGLAEILPIEIAQLLIKDETETNEEKAVSYISKEPLAGELQNFVNNLIGTEIIESHISDKSGLLLSLEDSKSAVNLELAQVSGEKSIADKIVVQTLVVPEKSKLLSLMGDVQNKKGLFRLDNSQIQNLNNLGESLNKSNGIAGESKPTLSVYSFNYIGENIESLVQNAKSGQELKHNLNLIKSQNSKILNVQGNKTPIDKPSLIPSEIKNEQKVPVGIMNENNSQLKPLHGDLNLIRTEAGNVPKDYSVSKITIVKKQSDSINPEKLQVNNNLSKENLNSELKRIDFSKSLASKNIQINNLTKANSEKTAISGKLNNGLSKTLSNNYSISTKNIDQGSILGSKTNAVNETVEQRTTKNTQLNSILKNVGATNLNKTETKQALTNNTNSAPIGNSKSKIISNNYSASIKNIDHSSGSVNKNESVLGSKTNVVKETVEHQTLKNVEATSLNKTETKQDLTNNAKEALIGNNKSKTISNNYSTSIKNIDQSSSSVNKNESVFGSKTNAGKETVEHQTLKNVEATNLNKTETKQDLINNAKETLVDNNKLPHSENKILQTGNIPKTNLVDLDKTNGAQKFLSTESNQENTEQDSNIKKVLNIDGHLKTENVDLKAANKQNMAGNEKLNLNNSAESKIAKEIVIEVEKGSKSIEILKNANNEKNISSEDKSNLAQSGDAKQWHPDTNKKISVKVKGGVKSVNEKVETNVKNNQNISGNETPSNKKDANKENSSSSEFKNNPFHNTHFNMKVNTESGFKQFLSENEMVAADGNVKAASLGEHESEVKLKAVKSAEVLKEITKFITKQEKGSLSFDIKPEQLGKMKITLDTAEHVVRARIEVESEQAKQLIEKNLDKLHQELSENGIELSSLNISLSNSKQNKEEKEMMENNKNNEKENNGQVGETEEEEKKKQLGYNTYEYIA